MKLTRYFGRLVLIAFIAFLIIGGVSAFGGALSGWFTTLGNTVTGWTIP